MIPATRRKYQKMAGECSNLEEEIYWAQFRTVQFCQFLPEKFIEHLTIPKKFIDNLKEKMETTVVLRGPSGHVWNVGLVCNEDTLLLKLGWKEFVEDHSLAVGDILIFKYNGDSRFDVLMFDGESLCEKASSYFIKKGEHVENRHSSQQSEISKRQCENDNKPSDDDYHVAKKWRSGAAGASSSNIQPSRVTANGETEIDCPMGAHLQSRRRAITLEDRQKAYEKAVAALSDNSAIVFMWPSFVYYEFVMQINDQDVTRMKISHSNQTVKLQVKGKTWEVQYQYISPLYGHRFFNGWKKFVVDNFLEEFDVCLFDYAGGSQDVVVLDVRIFRVVKEVIPPSWVTGDISNSTFTGARLCSWYSYDLRLKSRRKEVSIDEKENAHRMAVAAASENSCIVVINSDVYSGQFTTFIPSEWAYKHLPTFNPGKPQYNVEIGFEDKTWKSEGTQYDTRYSRLSGDGWRNFLLQNFVEEFDICLFDRVGGRDGPIVLNVKLFRVVEEVVSACPVLT